MLWSMLITEKSINIKVNAISKSSVAKHYQKSLRIQEKWLPKPKSNEWTSLSINTFSGSLFWYHFLFYFILFYFTILYWFCHISKWICHRYTCVPHPEPSSLPPPHTIPLGHPSAPAPSIQYCALNLDWRLVSYMILYIFQCHSPKSSHPLPLPQSPIDCSIHQCLFCCLVYRVIVTIFLNSIYMC